MEAAWRILVMGRMSPEWERQRAMHPDSTWEELWVCVRLHVYTDKHTCMSSEGMRVCDVNMCGHTHPTHREWKCIRQPKY